ncbi:hypothetical protein [Flavobacterium soli]|uniref:hypothetical protein n=1 Tax=Flavobacterium soli TaxID=344881 RepID=UPI0004135156|nr:hypothetical protein [Flavobacterium soli]
MNLPQQIAKHLRDVYFGGNWSVSNLKDTLSDVNWQHATQQIHSFNTIAVLTYHVGYFVSAVAEVLEGKPLNAKDEYSFLHPPIESEEDWQQLLEKTWADAEKFANLIEQLPESIFFEDFIDEKYGNYYRNLSGIIEHLHYHLGQIVIIKKMVQNRN